MNTVENESNARLGTGSDSRSDRLARAVGSARAQAALKQSRQAQHKGWQSLLLPLGLVILFVLLLIALAQLS